MIQRIASHPFVCVCVCAVNAIFAQLKIEPNGMAFMKSSHWTLHLYEEFAAI